MKILNLTRSGFWALVVSSFVIIGFQNCTKAKFVVDDVAKQKALDDGTIFDNETGIDPVTGLPLNNGGIDPVTGLPLNNGGIDPITGLPRTNNGGMDPFMGGNTPGSGSSTSIVLVPRPVCGPAITSKTQSMLPTTSKVVAVLYKSSNFATNSATFVQAWDSAEDMLSIRSQLASNKAFQLALKSPLVAGSTYSVVIYDASKVAAPYKYNFNGGSASAVAPIMDSIVQNLDYTSTFNVNSKGEQSSSQVLNVLVSLSGDPLCQSAGAIDPLLLQLKTSTPQPIALTAPEKGVLFDLLGIRADHNKVRSAWFATAETENYFLVLPNNDGKVLGIDELFGDATLGPDRKFAKQGFAALAKYDDNQDKMISSDDEVFPKLKLWKDKNLDGIAQAEELHSLDDKGVVLIDLRFDRRYKVTDQHGNVTKYRSVIIMKNGEYGLVYDLYLRYVTQ